MQGLLLIAHIADNVDYNSSNLEGKNSGHQMVDNALHAILLEGIIGSRDSDSSCI